MKGSVVYVIYFSGFLKMCKWRLHRHERFEWKVQFNSLIKLLFYWFLFLFMIIIWMFFLKGEGEGDIFFLFFFLIFMEYFLLVIQC